VASIVGFGKAAERALETISEEESRVRGMRDRFEQTLRERIPDVFVNGHQAARLPNTASLSFPGADSSALLMLLDRQMICCSAGSACLSGSLEASHVLKAMKLSDARLRSNVRFSFGRFNTEAEIDRALQVIPAAVDKIRAMSA
jgi:cysteine desulfurase